VRDLSQNVDIVTWETIFLVCEQQVCCSSVLLVSEKTWGHRVGNGWRNGRTIEDKLLKAFQMLIFL